jgi:serine/threonine protein kinase
MYNCCFFSILDIKPSNLLLDKGTVKLADFGCSATVSLSGDNNKYDQTLYTYLKLQLKLIFLILRELFCRSEVQHDTVIGTTVYMSPEIMRGSDDDETATCGYGRKTVSPILIPFKL